MKKLIFTILLVFILSACGSENIKIEESIITENDVLLGGTPAFGNGGGGSWTHYEEIRIARHLVGSDLTNFAVLLTEDNISSAMFSTHCQADGDDIRFATSTETGEIAVQVVTWATTTPDAEIWVKVPTVTSAATTSIYMFCGNSSATAYAVTDTYGSNNVWNSNYKAVFHLKETGSGAANEYVDSTSNDNDGQGGGGSAGYIPTKYTSGQIGDSQDFDGSNDYILLPHDSTLNFGAGNFSISAWINFDVNTIYQTPYFKGQSDASPQILLSNYNGTDQLGFDLKNSAATQNSYFITSAISENSWALYTFVRATSDNKLKVYRNGSLLGASGALTLVDTDGTENAFIGCAFSAGTWAINGKMDEVHVSSAELTANWLLAEYYNQGTPATFALEQGITEISGGGGDTCTYSGSGDWTVLESDNCYISTAVYVVGALNIIGGSSGAFNCNSSISYNSRNLGGSVTINRGQSCKMNNR